MNILMQQTNGSRQQDIKLEFTGNWFIDAGILGFVNLMEEVYGWDLDTLQEMIAKEPEKLCYGYFPLAYIYYNILKTESIKDPKKPSDNIFQNSTNSKNDIFDKCWEFVKKNYLKEGRVALSSKYPFFYFHNFLFFQPRRKEDKQKKDFLQILGLEKAEAEAFKYMDRTFNKFLPSGEKFSNISYTESLLDAPTLERIIPLFGMFILTFPLAFLSVRSEKDNTLFYSPDVEFTHKVNKKLKFLLERKTKNESIFDLSWKAVVDEITEKKSQWALENMYIITYKIGGNQEILDVEYIGIPKLQASVLLDDTIREHLNREVRAVIGPKEKWWLLEEFIKGKPLYPIVLSHVNSALNKNTYLNFQACLSSLIIEANILNARSKNIKVKRSVLFSDDYFDNYKYLVNKIKEDERYSSYYSSLIRHISDDDEIKKRIARELITALRAMDKNLFLNILLKNLNEKKELCSNNNFNKWIFEKIIENDVSFERYGLVLAMNCVGG